MPLTIPLYDATIGAESCYLSGRLVPRTRSRSTKRLMDQHPLFNETDTTREVQAGFGLDDGGGLRVVSAGFRDESKFDWSLFNGYDTLKVMTYSASINAIVRMLDRFNYDRFECIFGYFGILRDFKDILSFQKVVISDMRAAIMGLRDERHVNILEHINEGKARFFVVRKNIAHAKLYLLSHRDGRTRVVVGSANLSERAFSGTQPETLVKFDDDEKAWQHYNAMYERLKQDSADEIPLPAERITEADIEISETPVMKDTSAVLIVEAPDPAEVEVSAPVHIGRVEKVAAALGPGISAALPAIHRGKQKITSEIKREISRIKLVKTVEEADNRYFTIDRENRTALLSGKSFPLEWDTAKVKTDAGILVEYFNNYQGAFEGNVPRLQTDYFTLAAWLYFSPFICDMRSLALLTDSDVIKFPSFAIIFGKSNCGKTSLVDTLMTSMFGYSPTIDKQSFTAARLIGLQQAYKRLPVVFDDIGRNAFNRHGRDMIKNEMQPPVSEFPGFILSMNAEPQSFPDEVVKRSLMIYTTTALPPHNEELRQRLQGKIQEMRRELTGHFYRRYLFEVMELLEQERLPDDWLAVSTGVMHDIVTASGIEPPAWCIKRTWLNYAEKRYDRVKARLDNLLRPSVYSKHEGAVPSGWKIEKDAVIVWEQRDAFGRRGFDWEDVPSTLINEEASGGNRTVLHRASLESFLGHRVRPVRQWWLPWRA